MRLRAIAFALAAFGATGAGAWWIGEATADYAERRLAGDLATALAAAGHEWAEIRADGLILTLAGDAPDETARFHAIEIARQAAGPGRLLDAVAVAPADPAAAPAFALELLRSGEDVSLIGLVPADGARETIAAGLAAAGIGATVTDMLETADHPAPPAGMPRWPTGLPCSATFRARRSPSPRGRFPSPRWPRTRPRSPACDARSRPGRRPT
jgi:OmpA-OmpF porin, OOP family